ncbi:enoyl-CoA hydratase-related protein [Nocardioides pantholopis]|uniref:enoyl-CoA hydratase-related protein n=1 Tax=Nocardioides pantholopis TaxID=2483798 RepID=UPI000FD86AC7|nr:enoyl-CoA hydratase-related protein [Nocardioides pantholopis]
MSDSAAAPDRVVHYEVSDGLATITLDSPHNRNALSRQLVGELVAALDRAAADDDARVVLIRATGTVFCSGADLAEAATGSMEEGALTIIAIQRRILTLPKPVVTRVHGAVRAGGTGIVAASDVAISAEEASFALTEVKLGLAPAAISVTVLPRMTSRAAALACLGGETFRGADAAAYGLVTSAVPRGHLDEAVDAVCASLGTGAAQGLRETKALLNRELVERLDARGPELAALSARLFGSEEAKEAMLAFLSRSR